MAHVITGTGLARFERRLEAFAIEVAVIAERQHQVGDPSPGGSTRQPVMTAYRQRALVCAALLRVGPGRPRDLRTVAPDAGAILLANVYGWFERTERGVYRLTSLGETALLRWPSVSAMGAAAA